MDYYEPKIARVMMQQGGKGGQGEAKIMGKDEEGGQAMEVFDPQMVDFTEFFAKCFSKNKRPVLVVGNMVSDFLLDCRTTNSVKTRNIRAPRIKKRKESLLLLSSAASSTLGVLPVLGPAAILAKNCIKHVEVLDNEEDGMEAVWKIEVEDFPAFIVVDDKGNDFFIW